MTNMQMSSHSSAAGQRGLSGCTLKMIAVFTMFIDHTAATILERMLVQMPAGGPVTQQNIAVWQGLYLLMRLIGRMAFPIYCFLLVEGFFHTANRAKYALRLFLFALISEVPFDMAFNQKFLDTSYNNVFITLLIGLLTIWTADYAICRYKTEGLTGRERMKTQNLRGICVAAVLLTGGILAEILHTDYGAGGVAAIFVMYLFCNDRMRGFSIMVLVLGLLCGMLEWAAFLMLIPLRAYNGTRGQQVKYFFYWFYPVHLLVLSLICMALGLGI